MCALWLTSSVSTPWPFNQLAISQFPFDPSSTPPFGYQSWMSEILLLKPTVTSSVWDYPFIILTRVNIYMLSSQNHYLHLAMCCLGGGDGAESHDLLTAGCRWWRQLAAGGGGGRDEGTRKAFWSQMDLTALEMDSKRICTGCRCTGERWKKMGSFWTRWRRPIPWRGWLVTRCATTFGTLHTATTGKVGFMFSDCISRNIIF